jgi:hypothetical protein
MITNFPGSALSGIAGVSEGKIEGEIMTDRADAEFCCGARSRNPHMPRRLSDVDPPLPVGAH